MSDTPMRVLTRDDILNAKLDDVREFVEVPEWDGGVYVRMLNALEMDNFCRSISKMDVNWRARFVVLCACDDGGKRLFEKNHAGDLGKQSSKAIQRVFDAGWTLNGMSKEDAAELEKNSEATTDDD